MTRRSAKQCFDLAHDMLGTAGFRHYETSNYARPGHRSVHNRGYWRGEDYLGLGPSAVTTIDRHRSRNIADTARYIDMIAALGHAIADTETLDDEALRLERIALLLRTDAGIPLDLLDPPAARGPGLDSGRGMPRRIPARLRHPPSGRGRALVDPIAAELA